MVTDFRKLLDAVAAFPGGWKAGEIRSKMFRHTYCAARLQTLDHGAPVSEYTVAKELGQGGETLIRRVYGPPGASTSPRRSGGVPGGAAFGKAGREACQCLLTQVRRVANGQSRRYLPAVEGVTRLVSEEWDAVRGLQSDRKGLG